MITKYIIPIAAIAGLIFAIVFVRAGSKPIVASQPVAQPAQAPFVSYIAGAGIIEASSENIAIGTLVAGVVSDVYVKVGDEVKKSAPLFKIDDRDLQAELIVRQAALNAAKEKLSKLLAQPRQEDIPAVEAKVNEAEAALVDAKEKWQMWESLPDKRAMSMEQMTSRKSAVSTAEARLRAAQAELALLKAGAWKPDIEIAKADVASAEAQIKSMQIAIDRLTVRASVDGRLLQVKIHVGEFAPAGVLAQPLMLLGDISTFNVRVDIDENDAWRLKPNSRARAFVRGNKNLATDIKFVRVEPYVVPKKSLTGDSQERVDTRVLQVLFGFPREALPVYVGQQMDVFIDAPPVSNAMDPVHSSEAEGQK